jgi:hypothetical protein
MSGGARYLVIRIDLLENHLMRQAPSHCIITKTLVPVEPSLLALVLLAPPHGKAFIIAGNTRGITPIFQPVATVSTSNVQHKQRSDSFVFIPFVMMPRPL